MLGIFIIWATYIFQILNQLQIKGEKDYFLATGPVTYPEHHFSSSVFHQNQKRLGLFSMEFPW